MLKLKIVSPEKILYDGEADLVKVPGAMGEFEILTNHAPIISALAEGVVEYAVGDDRTAIHVAGGFVKVQKNEVSLCIERE